MAIESVGISTEGENSIKSRWGVTANEYNYNGARIDLQDLMVAVSKRRATSVEGEVEPLTTRIQMRNDRLEELGDLLAELTKAQTEFESDAVGEKDMTGWLSSEAGETLKSLGYWPHTYNKREDDEGAADPDDDSWVRPEDDEERADFYYATWAGRYSANRKTIEGMLSKVKSEIDGLNNESQLDMSRLQQLVDRRDESFTTATSLMTEISETRDNTIRNL